MDQISEVHELGNAFESHGRNILRSYLNFSSTYGRTTDFKSLLGLLLVSFKRLGEKILLKYIHIGPCSDQT